MAKEIYTVRQSEEVLEFYTRDGMKYVFSRLTEHDDEPYTYDYTFGSNGRVNRSRFPDCIYEWVEENEADVVYYV